MLLLRDEGQEIDRDLGARANSVYARISAFLPLFLLLYSAFFNIANLHHILHFLRNLFTIPTPAYNISIHHIPCQESTEHHAPFISELISGGIESITDSL